MLAPRALSCLFVLLAAWQGALLGGDPPRSEKFAGKPREAPSRDFDFQHLKLECSFDWEERRVDGTVTHTAVALRGGVRRVVLDAVDIEVLSVEGDDGRRLGFESFPARLVIDLGRPCRRGDKVRFTVAYRARPRLGIYFFEPDAAYPMAPRQLWSQGECEEARHWIPLFDHPIDKVTSEIVVAAPRPLTAVSNGKLLSVSEREADRIFHWRQDKPHSTYLITLVLGEFALWQDTWKGIPLTAYVEPRFAERAERSFALTADMMEFFSTRTGYPYPWDKYDQVCVHGFNFGGMENTSATTLTDRTLHDERAALDHSSLGLVAHELAHQWFGNLVTCRDWGDIWLNESFATFWANLYREHREGWDEALYERWEDGNEYLEEDRQRYRRRLSVQSYHSPEDVFDRHAYPKGGRILNMLRYVLGDEAFFAGTKLYLERHAFQAVETADFRRAMEDASGHSLGWFFAQWVHSGGHPVYRIASSWDETGRTLQVEIEQKQKVDDLTPLFRMPVVIEATTPAGKASHRIWVERQKEVFSLPLAERPRLVRFDPGDWILKEVELEKSQEELLYQLEHDEDMLGRLAAAEALAAFGGSLKARKALVSRLRSEPFWGVRRAIALSLGKLEGEDALSGLLEAFASEPKSSVRREILASLKKGGGEKAAELASRALASDPSYQVAAEALRLLGAIDPDRAYEKSLEALERDSHLDVIRSAAIETLARGKHEGDRRALVLERIEKLAAPGNGPAARTSALGALAQIGKGSDVALERLTAALEDRLLHVRWSAIEGLAQLGDRRGLEALAARRQREVGSIFRNTVEAIDRAMARINGEGDVEELRKALESLRRSKEELEERLSNLERRGGQLAF
jgi:aminopeptidase N